MKKNKTEEEFIKNHFITTSEMIVKKMETPANFLQFITLALEWSHGSDLYKPDLKGMSDPFVDLTSLIECVLLPWMEGGKDVIDNMAKGLEKIHISCSSEDYYRSLGGLTLAYGQYNQKVGRYPDEINDKCLTGISTLFGIGHCFLELDADSFTV